MCCRRRVGFWILEIIEDCKGNAVHLPCEEIADVNSATGDFPEPVEDRCRTGAPSEEFGYSKRRNQ